MGNTTSERPGSTKTPRRDNRESDTSKIMVESPDVPYLFQTDNVKVGRDLKNGLLRWYVKPAVGLTVKVACLRSLGLEFEPPSHR